VRRRVLAHPFVVRLLAVVLAVAGASGVTNRAPQALRAFTDTAAEVASAGPRRGHDRSAPRRAVPSTVARERLAVAPPALPAPLPLARASHAWPCASDLRQLLALKQSRLI
jgi:hypothetical protein